jgi:hypothetical protein
MRPFVTCVCPTMRKRRNFVLIQIQRCVLSASNQTDRHGKFIDFLVTGFQTNGNFNKEWRKIRICEMQLLFFFRLPSTASTSTNAPKPTERLVRHRRNSLKAGCEMDLCLEFNYFFTFVMFAFHFFFFIKEVLTPFKEALDNFTLK